MAAPRGGPRARSNVPFGATGGRTRVFMGGRAASPRPGNRAAGTGRGLSTQGPGRGGPNARFAPGGGGDDPN